MLVERDELLGVLTDVFGSPNIQPFDQSDQIQVGENRMPTGEKQVPFPRRGK